MLIVLKFYACLRNNFIEMFCAYLKLDMDIDMDIDMVIYCVELVAFVFKFCTCELLDMDNGVDYDM